MTQPAIDTIAPISRRAVAYLIDALIAGGIAIVGGVVLGVLAATSGSIEAMLLVTSIGYGVLLLVLLGWLVVYTVMQSKTGSIGMRAQGVRLASADDWMPVGFGRALLRNLVFGVSCWIVVGYFTPLFDSSGRFQGWHDKAANALMLDARKSPLSAAVASVAPAAPATTAMPVVPGIPGIPAVPAPSAPGAFAAPTQNGFAAPVAPVGHGVPPVPPVPPVSPQSHQPQGQYPQGQTPQAPHPAAYAPPVPPLPPQAGHPAPPAYTPPVPDPPAPAGPSVVAASGSGAGEGPLIAFVPGVTQPGPPSRSQDDGLDPSLDVTVIQDRGAATGAEQAPADASAPSAWEPPAAAQATASAPAPAPQIPETPVDPREAEIEATRISIPGHGLVFTWDDGVRMTVTRRTIFGRNPAPEDGAVLVPVRDETLSLSKTHFEAAADVSGGWVLDRHSTNGMTIVRDGQRIACPAGQRVPVRLGDAIEIGDRIVMIGGYA